MIDDANTDVTDHPHLADIAASRLATWPNDPPASTEAGGWEDYAGPFDAHFELEDLSQRALVVVATEFSVQAHLLARAMMAAVARRDGEDAAVEIGRKLFSGLGWIAAERLVPVLEVDDSLAAIAEVLRTCHLTLIADYLGLDVTLPTPDEVVVTLSADAPALAEGDPFTLSALLDLGADEVLESIIGGVNPRARLERTDGGAGVRAAWRITIDPAAEPSPSRARSRWFASAPGPPPSSSVGARCGAEEEAERDVSPDSRGPGLDGLVEGSAPAHGESSSTLGTEPLSKSVSVPSGAGGGHRAATRTSAPSDHGRT